MNRILRCHPTPRRTLAALAGLAAIIVSAPVAAEPAAGFGVGTYTCAEAAKAVRGDRELDLLYFSWAQGWMTGWNLAQMNASLPTVDLNTLSVTNQRTFIKTYCALHANGLYMDAVHNLYESMRAGGK